MRSGWNPLEVVTSRLPTPGLDCLKCSCALKSDYKMVSGSMFTGFLINFVWLASKKREPINNLKSESQAGKFFFHASFPVIKVLRVKLCHQL